MLQICRKMQKSNQIKNLWKNKMMINWSNTMNMMEKYLQKENLIKIPNTIKYKIESSL